jgi:hypothetical protein
MNEPHDRRPASAAEAFGLARTLSWFDGFSIALGVPALLLFSVGSIVVLTGILSPADPDRLGDDRPAPGAVYL